RQNDRLADRLGGRGAPQPIFMFLLLWQPQGGGSAAMDHERHEGLPVGTEDDEGRGSGELQRLTHLLVGGSVPQHPGVPAGGNREDELAVVAEEPARVWFRRLPDRLAAPFVRGQVPLQSAEEYPFAVRTEPGRGSVRPRAPQRQPEGLARGCVIQPDRNS